MKSTMCCLLGLIFAAEPAVAQIIPNTESVDGSAAVRCPAQVEWPDLLESYPPVFMPIMLIERGHSEEVFRRPAAVPQYAFFMAPGEGSCVPVVVVHSQPWAFGYISLDGSRSNMAAPWHFQLLGSNPPGR